MNKLKAMQTFVQIVDSGSLTAAADALETSLTAVVRTLAALERELGVRLLNRTTRRIALTSEGHAYLSTCREVITAIAESEATLTSRATEPSGHVVITAPLLFGRMYVAPAITRFLKAQQKMSCELLLLDRVVNLVEENIDLGVRIGPLSDSSLIARRIGQVRRVICASPKLLNRIGRPRKPRDLLQVNFITITTRGAGLTFSDRNGRKQTVAVRGNLRVNHLAPAIDACIDELGFGSFLSYQVAPAIAAGKLEVLLEKFELEPLPIHLVYPSRGLLPLRTRSLIEWLQKALVAFDGRESS